MPDTKLKLVQFTTAKKEEKKLSLSKPNTSTIEYVLEVICTIQDKHERKKNLFCGNCSDFLVTLKTIRNGNTIITQHFRN